MTDGWSRQRAAIGVMAGVVAAAGLVVVGVMGWKKEEAPKPAIRAEVRAEREALVVVNLDEYDWPGVRVFVDGVARGYRARLEWVRAGEQVRIPWRDLVRRDGLRFDGERRRPVEVMVQPDGLTGARFGF